MSVLVAIPHRGSQPPAETAASVISACAFLKDADMIGVRRPYSVCNARNEAVRRLLESEHTHLMFVDEDVHIPPDCITGLLSLDTDIATGQVPCIHPHVTGLNIPFLPIVTEEVTGKFGKDVKFRWVKDSKRILRCGAACLLVKREVFESLGFPWFRWLADTEESHMAEPVGEDVDFCDRAIAAGFEIKVHGQVRCSHIKETDISSQMVEEWQTPHDISWHGPISVAERQKYPDYGSHIPVLMTLAELKPIKKVIEFGSGKWSTSLFLDKRFFPDLVELISIENDEGWVEHVSSRISDDRFRIVLSHLNRVNDIFGLLPDPDLVFIDCDGEIEGDTLRPANKATDPDPSSWEFYTYNTRSKIYEHYASRDATVVIHDTQEEQMCDLLKPLYGHEFYYEPEKSPATGVFSNSQDVSKIKIKHTINTWDFRGLPR